MRKHQAINNGGNSDGDPPLPIPNREVKPVSADGTAIPSGRVGSRQPSEDNQKWLSSFFLLCEEHCHRNAYSGDKRGFWKVHCHGNGVFCDDCCFRKVLVGKNFHFLQFVVHTRGLWRALE